MYELPHGKEELEGIANRTDCDLDSHTKNILIATSNAIERLEKLNEIVNRLFKSEIEELK